MLATIGDRWRRFKVLLGSGWFLGFFYGESLRAHPLKVALKMMTARIAFVVPFPFLLPDRHFLMRHRGAKMWIQLNLAPMMWDLASGAYEYWTTRLFFDLVKEDMTVLDIGAHQGYYSILFAGLMKDTGKVLAFEPDPRNSEWLRKSIEANGYKSIELHEYALSDKEGEATFYPAGGSGSLVHCPSGIAGFDKPRECITVRTRTVDSTLDETHIRNVDLIKMDVEGADLLVLKGAERTLRTMNVGIVMDVDVVSYAERKELYDLLTSSGFTLYSIGSRLRPIKTADEVSLFLGSEPRGGVDSDHCASGQMASQKRRLKDGLPKKVEVVSRFLLNRYLLIPVAWIRKPKQVRQIYATKSDEYLRSADILHK